MDEYTEVTGRKVIPAEPGRYVVRVWDDGANESGRYDESVIGWVVDPERHEHAAVTVSTDLDPASDGFISVWPLGVHDTSWLAAADQYKYALRDLTDDIDAK